MNTFVEEIPKRKRWARGLAAGAVVFILFNQIPDRFFELFPALLLFIINFLAIAGWLGRFRIVDNHGVDAVPRSGDKLRLGFFLGQLLGVTARVILLGFDVSDVAFLASSLCNFALLGGIIMAGVAIAVVRISQFWEARS